MQFWNKQTYLKKFEFLSRLDWFPSENDSTNLEDSRKLLAVKLEKLPLAGMIARVGWSESSRAIHMAGDDFLVLGEFSNLDCEDLEW